MNRIPEPELMTDEDQAQAYAEADFEEPHRQLVQHFVAAYPQLSPVGHALDLGCGPGDVTIRLAHALPQWTIDAVDGSAAMLEHARTALVERPELARRIRWIEGYLPGLGLSPGSYDLVFSNSLLHHLPEPQVLWETVKACARPGAVVFVSDLSRPESPDTARRLVETHSPNEPEILKRDFYNSLLAAFEPDEVRSQLARAGLASLRVRRVSDRHLVVTGRLPVVA